jgi:hypothetical protein
MIGEEMRRKVSHPENALLSEEASLKLAWRRSMFWERRASKRESSGFEEV